MKTLHRPDADRIHRTDAWKSSAYSFVPYQTNFGEMCGLADDLVAPAKGFAIHPHRDMEISTIIVRGAQRHRDTTGATRVLGPNEVQTMSAGAGIAHSEENASETEPFRSFQLWVYPKANGGPPRHETFRYDPEAKRNRFLLALSPDRREGSALIGQDAFVSVATIEAQAASTYAMRAKHNGAYVHCIEGEVSIAGHRLGPGDAIGLWETDSFDVLAAQRAELLVVEVSMQRGVRP
jgi:redox-sensitive bicupin YhaK (pirin superfamily)